MKCKIIFVFSMIELIVLGIMMYMFNKGYAKYDTIPLIFMGIFIVLLISFIILMLVTTKRSDKFEKS